MASVAISVDEDVLRRAAEDLRSDLGDLSDLPRDLANTLANVYYRFFAYAEHMARGRGTNLLDPYLEHSHGLIGALAEFNKLHAEAIASIEHAKTFVRSAREIRKQNPALFSYVATLTLDVLKYNIDNANFKTPIRRAIERRFKKPREIPDLLDRMLRAGYGLYRSSSRP